MKKVKIYTPKPLLKNPLTAFKEMFNDLKDSKELAITLFKRDISSKYRQTILGLTWAIFPPILSALVFNFLNASGVLSFGESNIPYFVYAFIGTSLWQIFADSINSPIKSITISKPILSKINFPKESIILSGLGEILLNFFIRILLLIIILYWYDIGLTIGLLYGIISCTLLIGLGFVIGLLLAPIAMLFNDIIQALPTFIQLWFFITPVIYMTPDLGQYSWVTEYNPVSQILINSRNLFIGMSFEITPIYIFTCGITIIGLFLVWILYRISLPILIERMSA